MKKNHKNVRKTEAGDWLVRRRKREKKRHRMVNSSKTGEVGSYKKGKKKGKGEVGHMGLT